MRVVPENDCDTLTVADVEAAAFGIVAYCSHGQIYVLACIDDGSWEFINIDHACSGNESNDDLVTIVNEAAQKHQLQFFETYKNFLNWALKQELDRE